jgi:hypothetical protein
MRPRRVAQATQHSSPEYSGSIWRATDLGSRCRTWTDDAAAASWKQVAEHVVAQRRVQDRWYVDREVRVVTVTRAYGFGGDR